MITSIALTGIVLYGVVAGAMYFGQEKLLFLPNMPSRGITVTPAAIGLEYEDVRIRTLDDVSLHGWLVRSQDSDKVLIFFHGNAGNISHRLDSIRLFHELGLNVLIVDYRGYGQSTGKPSEQGTYKDAEAIWSYATMDLGFDSSDVILFGRSLGGSVAAWLASQHRPQALVVESAFTSAPDVASELYPLLPVRLLARLNYNTLEYVQNTHAAVLIIHSRDDEIIPFRHGQVLFGAAAEPKSFLELRGGHNDGFLVSHKKYSKALADFLFGQN